MTSLNIKSFLSTLQQKNSEATDLITQARLLNQLKQHMISTGAIPNALSRHYHLGPLSNGILVLLAENASVAAKLKHIAPSILSKIRHAGWNVTQLKIKLQKPDLANLPASTNPDLAANHAPHKKQRKLNQGNINHLEKLAQSLPDADLKHSIQVLLKNAAKTGDHT